MGRVRSKSLWKRRSSMFADLFIKIKLKSVFIHSFKNINVFKPLFGLKRLHFKH